MLSVPHRSSPGTFFLAELSAQGACTATSEPFDELEAAHGLATRYRQSFSRGLYYVFDHNGVMVVDRDQMAA